MNSWTASVYSWTVTAVPGAPSMQVKALNFEQEFYLTAHNSCHNHLRFRGMRPLINTNSSDALS